MLQLSDLRPVRLLNLYLSDVFPPKHWWRHNCCMCRFFSGCFMIVCSQYLSTCDCFSSRFSPFHSFFFFPPPHSPPLTPAPIIRPVQVKAIPPLIYNRVCPCDWLVNHSLYINPLPAMKFTQKLSYKSPCHVWGRGKRTQESCQV